MKHFSEEWWVLLKLAAPKRQNKWSEISENSEDSEESKECQGSTCQCPKCGLERTLHGFAVIVVTRSMT